VTGFRGSDAECKVSGAGAGAGAVVARGAGRD
jgi:hypothetical protein